MLAHTYGACPIQIWFNLSVELWPFWVFFAISFFFFKLSQCRILIPGLMHESIREKVLCCILSTLHRGLLRFLSWGSQFLANSFGNCLVPRQLIVTVAVAILGYYNV